MPYLAHHLQKYNVIWLSICTEKKGPKWYTRGTLGYLELADLADLAYGPHGSASLQIDTVQAPQRVPVCGQGNGSSGYHFGPPLFAGSTYAKIPPES